MPNLECSFTFELIHVLEIFGRGKRLKAWENVLCAMQKFYGANTVLNLMLISGTLN
jgi:hypothetical protein